MHSKYATEGQKPFQSNTFVRTVTLLAQQFQQLAGTIQECCDLVLLQRAGRHTRQIVELSSHHIPLFAVLLSDEALDGAMQALNKAYWIAKEKNKKYGRRKSKEVPQE